MNQSIISTWSDLQMRDMFYAYRKAKADCFFERSILVAQQFVEYESMLSENLAILLTRLKFDDIKHLLIENLGQPRLAAKKLGMEPKNDKAGTDSHGFFSDPARAFNRLCDTHELTPEFRFVGDFPVVMHILSALWINLVGHKFDEVLSASVHGSRLRRYRAKLDAPVGEIGKYHIEALGSFQPYFGPYKRWRGQGLNAIRTELQADRQVVAISLDLTSYYHHIDPAFIADHRFLTAAGIELTEWEQQFTAVFAEALTVWSDNVVSVLKKMGCDSEKVQIGGLPIGLSIARVVSNVLLVELDRDVEQGLAPVYYGRYVDDIFLVLRDPGNITDSQKLFGFIAARTKCFPANAKGKSKDEYHLALPGEYQGKTKLLLQQAKQKVFFLQGRGGIDLLDNIETQIRSVSSERRLMPSPERLETMASAKVLTAAGQPSEEADTLRKADGLAVRRLGWAIQLRAVETLARDLRRDDWKAERAKFYQFAHSHILRPDKILDHIDYLPRLLSLAVALTDWSEARRLVDASAHALMELERKTNSLPIKVNGMPASGANTDVWATLQNTLMEVARDTILRSLRWSQPDGVPRPLSEIALDLCNHVGLGYEEVEIHSLALAYREADWAKISYKDHLRRDAKQQRAAISGEDQLYGLYAHERDLREFLELSYENGGSVGATRVNPRCMESEAHGNAASMLPYLCSTRPYATEEIALFLPEQCVFGRDEIKPARAWARYVRAVRGVWVWDSLVSEDLYDIGKLDTAGSGESYKRTAFLGYGRKDQRVLLGVSSLLTTEESWEYSASGRSDISRERYGRIKRLVDQAITAYPKPTHLILPELSLPERWVDTVSKLLRDAGISLIAGLDYQHDAPNMIHSEAVLVLTDDRLGIRASVQIRQPKSMPAAGEEEKLLKIFGKIWPSWLADEAKPVYIHQGFCFGVLVCSELQNILHRQRFQGDVDCMMVLSWNQDLDTFSALVESASLDVHASIALVNNRMYGDSRVRTPAKESYDRDLCRIRGGKNEHVVIVELDTNTLRAFQSRATRWPSEDDPFKPVPEGFRIASYRKAIPR